MIDWLYTTIDDRACTAPEKRSKAEAEEDNGPDGHDCSRHCTALQPTRVRETNTQCIVREGTTNNRTPNREE